MGRSLSAGFLLLLAAAVCGLQMLAQDSAGPWDVPRVGGESITEPSPEATAMRRYQDFPVSYATGSADISIPLLELPGGQVSVALGLRYHTGGIKRNDISTGVGLGWSLTGLGQVSRQINGFPDEWKGYVNTQSVNFNLHTQADNLDYFISILEAKTEAEYDIYSYNFPGYSGSFYLKREEKSDSLKIVMLPVNELTVTRVADTTNQYATDAFIFTTPEGFSYRFDEKEHVEYNYNPGVHTFPYYDRNYEAVSTWNLSLITAPEQSDSIQIGYVSQSVWRRSHYLNLYSFDIMLTSQSGGSHILPDERSLQPSNYTEFKDQRLPSFIISRSGRIDFTIDRNMNNALYGPLDGISAISLSDNLGNEIKKVSFSNSDPFDDGRQRLNGLKIMSDGVVLESYDFTYNSPTANIGRDLFGYPNGVGGNGYCYSILDTDLNLSSRRTPSSSYVTRSLLSGITDINGLRTTLTYEPSEIEVAGNSYSIISGNTIIGVRLKKISVSDIKTGRSRTRTFSYENPKCNMDLSRLTIDAFITQSGTHTLEFPDPNNPLLFHYVYFLNTSYTATSKTRGMPIESAMIYYGKVTETVTGTGMSEINMSNPDSPKPIRKVYEYDLSYCQFPFRDGGGQTGSSDKHLGVKQLSSLYLSPVYKKAAMPHSTYGYYLPTYGGGPLLSCTTEYEWTDGDYQKRSETRNYYSSTDSLEHTSGLFCESIVYRIKDPVNPDYYRSLNIDSFNDINFYWTSVAALRTLCDSTVTTVYYPDGNSRSVTTRMLYDAEFTPNDRPIKDWMSNSSALTGGVIQLGFYRHPGCLGDSVSGPVGYRSFYPLGTIVSSGRESIATYRALSEFAGTKLKAAGCTLQRLPVVEKWVLRTSDGVDSLLRRYEYGRFNCGGHTLTRPIRVYVQTDGPEESRALISSQSYTGYDSRGRITGMVDAQGRRISAKWLGDYDLLSEMSLPDVGLTTTYSYQPLVGCTSITAPSGRKRSFSYSAGRLVEERNTAGDPVASYSYQLYGDGSSATAANRFSTTVHDSQGSATDVTYYDGFGLPVQTVATVAGDNLVRSSVTYDAIDRPVRQYLPVPADDASYNRNIQAAGQMHYDDTCPYAETRYRNMAGDAPLQVIREGEKMYGHPEKYEYLCNNTTDAMLRCRRYRLAGSADSESITLDGDYPAGALDVTRVTDPDGCTLLTFTDWRGLRILERRVVTDSRFADTYYLYDVLGNVRVILQPEGAAQMTSTTKTWTSTDNVLDQFAFINRYDRRGNLTYAKVPGAGPVEMRYDPLNRLAFRQTATMADQNESEFTLYDPIGRPALTGITTTSLPTADGLTDMTATYAAGTVGLDSTGYAIPSALSLPDARVTLANYYDSYDFRSRAGFNELVEDGGPVNTAYAPGNLTGTRTAVFSGDGCGYGSNYRISKNIYSLYGYDVEGNKTQQVSSSIIDGMQVASCIMYTRLGYPNFENTRYNYSGGFYETVNTTAYDAKGNKTGASAYLGSFSPMVARAQSQGNNSAPQYIYNSLGQLSKLRLKNDIDYSYDLHGKISGITSTAFSQTLKYEDGTEPCYNGNISEMTVAYNGGSPIKRSFTYDRLNRLTAQTSSDGYNTAYTYNLNSSPRTIMRCGLTSDGTVGTVDDLALAYNGNRLASVTDYADPVLLESSLDFPSDYAWFGYNADGNLNMDISRDITGISYSPGGMPMAIDIFGDDRFEYSYDALNCKLAENYRGKYPTSSRYYVGSLEFIKEPTDTAPRLVRANLPWGYLDANGRAYAYITDYQGNIRAVVDADGTAIQTTDYYPYGLPMATSTAPAANRYKYGAKEFETRNGLNFHDFEARMLFNDRTLFGRPDDKAGKYPNLNPFLYCAANPLRYIDPTGEDWIFNPETLEYISNHEVTSSSNTPAGYRYIGSDISNVFSDLNLKQGNIYQHDPKIGITFAGNTAYGVPTGTSVWINSVIVLIPHYDFMSDGKTIKFSGINIFGSISQKSYSSNPDLKLEYNGSMTVIQNDSQIKAILNKRTGENLEPTNAIIKCASIFIPLHDLLDKTPINVKMEAGAINSKVTFLPIPFKMETTINY